MVIEENILNQIKTLISRAEKLKIGDEYNQIISRDHYDECSGWFASALNIVQLICPNPKNAYHKRAVLIESRKGGFSINQNVGEFASLLAELERDVENGLLSSVADKARAETFDNFLDHAKEYVKNKMKNEGGVIVGVVFEDCIRRIYRKNVTDDKGEKLETIISDLTKKEIISQAKAKRARAAAHVRTKATHAQWDEFDINDVIGTISFTEELLFSYIDG